MLAFLVFTAILISCLGLIHKLWNKTRDEKDANDVEGVFMLYSSYEVTNIFS